MGLVKRIFGEDGGYGRSDEYLDLAQYAADAAAPETGAMVKVCEITRYEDLSAFTDLIYQGHVLVVDFGPVSKDEVMLKRLVNDLRKVTADVKGDVAGIGDHMLIATPGGLRVDRRKLRVATH